jgi:hypothetical protein
MFRPSKLFKKSNNGARKMNLEEIKEVVERIVGVKLANCESDRHSSVLCYSECEDSVNLEINKEQSGYSIEKYTDTYTESECIYTFNIPDNKEDFETVLRILELNL